MLKRGDGLDMWYNCAALFLKPEHGEMKAILILSPHTPETCVHLLCVLSTSGVAVPSDYIMIDNGQS